MQFLPTQKNLKIQSRSRLPTVKKDCSEKNRVASQMKFKMHNKISFNCKTRENFKFKFFKKKKGGGAKR